MNGGFPMTDSHPRMQASGELFVSGGLRRALAMQKLHLSIVPQGRVLVAYGQACVELWDLLCFLNSSYTGTAEESKPAAFPLP